MDVTVAPIFSAHRIGMVRSSKITPIVNKPNIVGIYDVVSNLIEFLHGVFLHIV